ncbi:MAG: TlyA family RNA methyltransferase [Kiritimatiellae bacterium]|nr:TlyA family RNA methyltransferase [Kiritimatiellia bacterium]
MTTSNEGDAARRPRLDLELVRRGLAESRALAQRLILAGRVRVDGQIERRAARAVFPQTPIELVEPPRFVSRGGEKLDAAFDAFGLDVRDRVALDIGASTGGFTDCLLRRGARRVYAVDVGRGQLHWSLRRDPRVVPMEGVNARHLTPADVPERAGFAAVDVSFISLRLVLPSLPPLLEPGSYIVTLIKPQFEAGRRDVGRGGVVRDEQIRMRVVDELREFGVHSLGLEWIGVVRSPLRGPAGNVEFLAAWKRP